MVVAGLGETVAVVEAAVDLVEIVAVAADLAGIAVAVVFRMPAKKVVKALLVGSDPAVRLTQANQWQLRRLCHRLHRMATGA